MLHAEQEALIQEANLQLVTIREAELQNYIKIYSQFAVQGALFAGFTVQALTNVDAMDSTGAYWWKYVYWVASAAVMIVSIHLVLVPTFVNTFGSGLALRGKAGSLIRAVDGMLEEINPTILFFILSVLAFQISALGLFFILMTPHGAIACSGVVGIGIYYWYQGCVRIYNRFRAENAAWREENADNIGPLLRDIQSTDSFNVEDVSRVYNKQALLAAAKERFDRNSSWLDPREQPADISLNFMEGYLSVMDLSSRSFFKQNWTRYYFVLQRSDIYYYEQREDYLLHPKESVKNRPISIAGYYVMAAENDSGIMEIILTPKSPGDERRVWTFHVETPSECEQWMEAFEIAGNQPAMIPHATSPTSPRSK